MEGVLVDTNVVSYLLKGDSRGDLYRVHLDGKLLYVSFASIAELYRWAIQRNWGAARIATLRENLTNYVVLPYDDQTTWEWARIMSVKGSPIAPGDAWIAAAGIRHGLPIVTHNRKHFERISGLRVISEA
jgi:tRNA(fMet)-specific endonuclease VapC